DAEATEYPRQIRRLRVHPQARLGHPPDPGEAALPAGAVLEVDDERPAHLALVRFLHRPRGDVPLGLEDLGDVRLDLRVGHRHALVVRLVGVTQTGQHVCNRIGHGHWSVKPFSPRFPPPGLRRRFLITTTPWRRREVRRGAPFPGCTRGTARTCGTPPWAGHTAGSGCTRGPRTSASSPP